MNQSGIDFQDRDLSWVGFNGRVLQEAGDARNPLIERLRFLAIFSSNLDEFYAVRVASLRSMIGMGKSAGHTGVAPLTLVRTINRKVDLQQQRFGEIFRNELLPALAEKGVHLLDEHQLKEEDHAFVQDFVQKQVLPHVKVKTVQKDKPPFLENGKLYFIVKTNKHLLLLNIPSKEAGRFVTLPSQDDNVRILQVGDAMRESMHVLLPDHKVKGAWAVKLSRDADLHLEEEGEKALAEKVKQSLSKRNTGLPARFLYDELMPADVLMMLSEAFQLAPDDLVPGGRYHSFSEFWSFPAPPIPELYFEEQPTLAHPQLEGAKSTFEAVAAKDRFLHFPYQKYDHVTDWLEEAAADKNVKKIKVTLYRVASKSRVTKALIAAAKAGKKVTAFVEIKARFDESSNLHWTEKMREAGITILPNFDKWKVHAKLFLIERKEGKTLKRYAYLGTGNFNEKTARIYSDMALFTAHPGLTSDVQKVFAFLKNPEQKPTYQHLLVAPYGLRPGLNALIDREIAKAKKGGRGRLILKMNGVEDEKIIRRLYKASQAGVQIDLLVRGICCVRPGVPGLSENIRIVSLLDRYLEHVRLYVAGEGEDEVMYLASADLMKRNLSRRVEVAFPLPDPTVYQHVRHILDLHLQDTVKNRVIDDEQRNRYVPASEGSAVSAQPATYAYLSQWQGEMPDAE